MRSEVIFDNGKHKWIAIGRDPEKNQNVIDTNEYLIIDNEDKGMILDPGGIEIFAPVLVETSKYILPENIEKMLVSHQDPDIASSLALWVNMNETMEVYCSWLWAGFISHFSMGTDFKFSTLPDEGKDIFLGTSKLTFVPAHYCHSSGNFSLYDHVANILFSGDIGAALVPDSDYSLFVEDFDSHIQYMEGFHRRWMPSKRALQDWVVRARALKPDMICPQHGSIFKGKNVDKFLNWLESIEVGIW